MPFQMLRSLVSVACLTMVVGLTNGLADEPIALQNDLETRLTDCTRQLESHPDSVALISQQGDLLFFLGRFADAVEAYDRMIALDSRQATSHWRRGIALFYAGRFEDAAAQFDAYHSFDNVDRENGIWRYLSHYRAFGKDQARAELLRYEKDDREPFGDVYQLFAEEIRPDAILEHIQNAEISETERDKRLFYAHLYIGLNELVEGRQESARKHLHNAEQSNWPQSAGYGPRYMWHVARLQHANLAAEE